MAEDEELFSLEAGGNTMLREATEALHAGDRARARDLLTRLLKTDQGNATYWVWLSAAVDTQKERLYCLQTAFQIDPQNAAAKRGLIMLGALPPDDSVPPFQVNRPRLWEEKLAVPKGLQEQEHGWANPVTRVFMILGIAVIILGLFVGGYMLLPKGAKPYVLRTPTRRPTATFTFTPSATPLVRSSTPTLSGPTPLWVFLEKTYTSTPLYVVTQHPILTRASFEAGLRSLAQGNYDAARVQFREVLKSEPGAADVYYYIGESYRAQGDDRTARDNYQEAIKRDPGFAPAFLGRAQANLGLNPDADVISDLNEAINLDPKYAEAYIERGKYQVSRNPSAAKSDLEAAIEITPDSALAYLYLAQAQLALGEDKAALASAQRANQIDMTLVPVYLALGQAYLKIDQPEQAIGALQTYTLFMPKDSGASLALGSAYNTVGQYQSAADILTKALAVDRRNAEAYFQRGYAYLNLDKANLAEADFKMAVAYDPNDFDSQLGLARAYDLQGLPGHAYTQVQQKAYPLAKTDDTKAQVFYWEARFLEELGDKSSLQSAKNYWYQLIALPADAMPKAWRDEAYQHLNITPTFTPATTFTPTVSSTQTPAKTSTQTPTKTPTKTP